MSDNEIIKALECCIDCDCKNCPCQTENGHCMEIDETLILDLINRQKAEIENLREENEIYRRANFLIAGQRDARDKEIVCLEAELESVQSGADLLKAEVKRLEKRLKTAKSEAIREFAERLKKLILPQLGISTLEKTEAYHFCLVELDNLVKEMTEEKL